MNTGCFLTEIDSGHKPVNARIRKSCSSGLWSGWATMNDPIQNNRRKNKRTCCSLDANVLFKGQTFKGRIENMSNFGAIVVTEAAKGIAENSGIRLSIFCDGKEDKLQATVVWSEEGAFGAKFNPRPDAFE